MLNFETHVNTLARNRDGEIFFNSGPEKASIVVSALFRAANQGIDIYSGCLDGNIYSREMFAHLLDEKKIPSRKVRVILTEPAHANEELVSYLQDRGIEVKSHVDVGGHLIVADGDCYRFEHDHQTKKAFFAFGAKLGPDSVLEKLEDAFKSMWDRAEKFRRANSAQLETLG